MCLFAWFTLNMKAQNIQVAVSSTSSLLKCCLCVKQLYFTCLSILWSIFFFTKAAFVRFLAVTRTWWPHAVLSEIFDLFIFQFAVFLQVTDRTPKEDIHSGRHWLPNDTFGKQSTIPTWFVQSFIKGVLIMFNYQIKANL